MSRPPALLAGDSPRSEHDPELGATAADTIAMHPVTGAFADPLHESAFAAHLFRLAFPCHAFLMALLLGLTIWTTLGVPAELSSVLIWRVIVPILALGLVGRVLVHRMNDSVRGQRIGSWTWMALVVLANTADMCGFLNAPAVGCAQIHKAAALLPLFYLATALINGSHGLGFVLKAALISPVLVKCFSAIAVCGEAGVVLMSIAILPMTIAGFVLTHMAELHLRHSYAEKQRLAEDMAEDKRRLQEKVDNETRRLEEDKRSLQEKMDDEKRRLEERLEQLRAEKERLMYDVQRRGQPLDDGDDRSAIRRGLLAGPSEPYQRANSTGSSETGAPAPSESPPPSLPPGAPSSSAGNSSQSGKSGKGTGRSSNAAHGKSTVPPRIGRKSRTESSTQRRLHGRGPSRGCHPLRGCHPKLRLRLGPPLGRNSTQSITQAWQSRRLSRGRRPSPRRKPTDMGRPRPPRAPARAPPPHQRRRCHLGLHLSRPRATGLSTGAAQRWPPHRRPSRRVRGGRGVRNARRPHVAAVAWPRSRRARGRRAWARLARGGLGRPMIRRPSRG